MPWPIKTSLIASAVGFALLPHSVSHAATQSLALLETGEPTPLICEGPVCKAEFSSFCLQKERDLPRAGDPYHIVKKGAVTLVLTTEGGAVERIPAAAHVNITAARSGHTAVTIKLSKASMKALGGKHAAIEVGERVALMPEPVIGDDYPQTEQDKHLATGPLRSLGQKIVDQGPHDADRVRVLNRLINTLPSEIDRRPDAQQSLWQKAVSRGFQNAKSARIAKAAKEYATCWQDRVVELHGYSVRHCLQRRHDGLMWQHVKRYWDAVGAGS